MDEEECPICFGKKNEKLFVRIPCHNHPHYICLQCFIHLEKRQCPLCRKSFAEIIPPIKRNTGLALIHFLHMHCHTHNQSDVNQESESDEEQNENREEETVQNSENQIIRRQFLYSSVIQDSQVENGS